MAHHDYVSLFDKHNEVVNFWRQDKRGNGFVTKAMKILKYQTEWESGRD
jgi:hypothetical protein